MRWIKSPLAHITACLSFTLTERRLGLISPAPSLPVPHFLNRDFLALGRGLARRPPGLQRLPPLFRDIHLEDGSVYRQNRPSGQRSENAGVRQIPEALAALARASGICRTPYGTELTHRWSLDGFSQSDRVGGRYSTRVKIMVKVLDFVQVGGPTRTELSLSQKSLRMILR